MAKKGGLNHVHINTCFYNYLQDSEAVTRYELVFSDSNGSLTT
jgi:hypothetical protein